MQKLFKFALMLVGLVLLSTLSYAGPPDDLSKTTKIEKSSAFDVTIVAVLHSYKLELGTALVPINYFEVYLPVTYLKPESDAKIDNTVINGIINTNYAWRHRQSIQ